MYGALRSVIPKKVNVMALIATSTKETLKSVKERLSVSDVNLIGTHPNQPNIKYLVNKGITMDEFCNSLFKELRELHRKVKNNCYFFVALLHNVLMCSQS